MMKFFALPLAGLLIAASTASVFARTPYDGAWNVSIITQAGDCDAAYKYPLRIADGKVQYDGSGSFTMSGNVASGGAVKVAIALGERKASGTGRLSSSGGTGKWSSTTGCSGRWEAERRS
jgi:hypothetical protein